MTLPEYEDEDVSVVTFLNEEAAKALKEAQAKLDETVEKVARKSAEYKLSLPPLILPPVDPEDVPTDPNLKPDPEEIPEDIKPDPDV